MWTRPLVLAFGLAAALALSACEEDANVAGGSANIQELIAKATKFHAEGNYRASIIELKNALQKNGRSPDARMLLGRIYLELGDPQGAEAEFIRARDLGTPKLVVTRPLGRAMLARRKYQDVLDTFPFDEKAPAALRATVLALRGEAHRNLMDMDQAKADLNKALEFNPGETLAHLGLARVAMTEDRMKDAQFELKSLRRLAPDDPEVMALKGDIEYAQGDFATSEATFQAIVDARPDNPLPIVPLARAMIAAGKIDEANERLDRVLKILPKHPGALYLRALGAYSKKDYALTENLSQRVLAIAPKHLPSELLAGASSYGLQHYEAAAHYLGNYVGQVPGNTMARRLYGAALMRQGRGSEALKVLEPMVGTAPDDETLLAMVGTAALQGRDFKTSKDYFEKIASLKPDDAPTRARLGALKIGMGEVDQGVKDLEKALELDPSLDRAAVALFAAHFREKKYQRALDVAKSIQASRPDAAIGFTMAGIAHFAMENRDAARDSFTKALEISPGAPDASENLANLEIQDGNVDKARALFERVLEDHPDNVKILLRLASLDEAQGDRAQARQRVSKAMELEPRGALPRIAMARLMLRENQPLKALDTAQAVVREYPDNVPLLTVIAQAQLAADQPADAAVTLRKLVAARPKVVDLHQLLATAYRRTGDAKRFGEEVDKILELNPDHVGALMTKVRLVANNKQFDQAHDLLARVKKLSPNDPKVTHLEGTVEISQGNLDKGITLLRQAQKAETTPSRTLSQALTAALWAADRRDEAFEEAETWLRKTPSDHPFRLALGNRYLALDRMADAERHFAKLVELEPKSWSARNNLAWVLMKQGAYERARSEAEQSLELSRNNPDVMDTLALILMASGDTGRAVDLLRTAARARPDSPTIHYHYAKALAQNGDPDEAKAVLGKVLTDNTAFGERKDAEALLKELGG
ncbi:MAG: PEP-CTERM system TPR-repeat protein PrsT [Rhodobacterales bacterium]|nr:PEP-CTERM system TPR-repeat protein PrsT [Rhodobacterales bacterium]